MTHDPRDHHELLFDSTYLRVADLLEQEVTVTIEKVERNVELTMRGGVKKRAPVMHFVGKKKPLVLNKTNRDKIAEIHGLWVKGWLGKKIVLFEDKTSLSGKTVPCIRIKRPSK